MRCMRSQRTGDRPHGAREQESKLYVGMDVHKDTVMVAVLPEGAPEPTVVKRLPNKAAKIRRWLARMSRQGEVWACYEASGAG